MAEADRTTDARDPRVLAIDAGGTMTDTFIVDRAGAFVVGKAQTTPEDESEGFMASAEDALGQWSMSPEEGFPRIVSGIFSGTAMLNRLLSRTGRRIGAIVTAGQEDYLVIERGIQTYLGFSYSDRLHIATHHHNPPIVDRELVKGVRGRIDVMGEEVLPLREPDVREAAEELLDAGVEGICVCLLFSYRNAEHEIRVAEILEEVKAARRSNGAVPVYVSSELYPLRRDLPRLNSTLIEAYAAEPSRGTLKAVRDRTKERGAGFELRVMASHGGTISIEARELARTLVSGPIGGVVGGQALANRLGLSNVLCTDIGGTSFDIALLTDGRFEITPTPDIARFMLNMPLVKIDSLGAGTGSFVRVNPNSNRPELGPDSAGSRIGVSWPEGGLETVSVTDLNVVLGRVNPDYFLGGEVQLDPERAEHEVRRQVAEPLGLDVTDAAAGVIELFEQTLRNEAVGRILGKGYSPADYALLCYGGGGPLHVAGYTEGVAYRDVLMPAWAAGFSAYGCACADFEYRYDQTIDMPILPTADDMEKAGIGFMITGAWQGLDDRVAAEFQKSGIERDAISFTHIVRMQYYGQLNDIEIVSPHHEMEEGEQVDELIAAFEDAYGKVYARSARSPELGYLVTQAIVTGSVEVEKPALPELEMESGSPPVHSTRTVRWSDGDAETQIVRLEEVRAGHEIEGPAIVEHSATTFAIPPGRTARLDSSQIFHLSAGD
ncbi:MAG TPA: hydantoinase/oxoprolinase family protein [Solirubrobacterales bacterium]